MTARERLRGLAQNATPGPWHQSELGYSVRCASGPVTNGSDRREDAAFIVAASPDVVLAMLDEIATLTARVEHYQRACITTSTEVTRVLGEALYGPTPDAWSTHTPEAIADEAASEIATLRAENERMRGEIITYQDAHTTGTEIIDGLRAKVEALEAELAYVDVCHACACVMMPSLQLCESCVLHDHKDGCPACDVRCVTIDSTELMAQLRSAMRAHACFMHSPNRPTFIDDMTFVDEAKWFQLVFRLAAERLLQKEQTNG